MRDKGNSPRICADFVTQIDADNSRQGSAFISFLHDDGYAIGDKRFKLFTFSQLMARKREITDDEIGFQIGDVHLPVKDVYIPRTPPAARNSCSWATNAASATKTAPDSGWYRYR